MVWCRLPDTDKKRRDKMYEFLMRLAEQNGVTPDIVFPGAEKARGEASKRRNVLPVAVDGEAVWREA